MNLYLDCSYRAPSHTAVLSWVKKYGLHLLDKPTEKADDWIIILDESVQFGQNRLLLIYGVRNGDISFSRSLTFKDLTPLAIISRASWTAERIAEQLDIVEASIGKIKYAVADQGIPIKKALKIKGITHVYDITHYISLVVEQIYKDDEQFKEYTKKLAHLRSTQALGKMSHILPPVQRVTARFMNLRPISDWGMTVLELLEKGPESACTEKEYLNWMLAYKEFIHELAMLNEMINQIQSVLKNRGLSISTRKECEKILEKAHAGRLYTFRENLSDHLLRTLKQILTPQELSDEEDKPIMCCSDIIESAFGKYKNYLQSNPMIGVTNLSLVLATFTGQLSKDEIAHALESTPMKKLEKWTSKNIGKTTLSRRMEVLNWNRNIS
jgi:hypothetical protein